MKFSVLLCLLILFIGGCHRNNAQADLLKEQKLLKDSANYVVDRIGVYMHKDQMDKAKEEIAHLNDIHARLIKIQYSIDKLGKMKQ